MASRLQDVIARGLRADQPAATGVAEGTIYYVTDELLTERSNGTTWDDVTDGGGGVATGITQLTGDVAAGPGSGSQAATLAAGSASVLNSGTLSAARLPALTGDVTTSVGTAATTIATGAVTTVKISDANVTYAKLQDVSAASKLLGRGSASGSGDVEEIALGTNLTMTGTTLAAIGGAPTTATYLVQTADATLSNEQAMGALATGLVKNTATTGVQTIAVDGTDYLSPSSFLATGRLTLTSGTAVTTSDVTSATTIYYTPYNGNDVALYTGSAWQRYTLTERSLALGTLTALKLYDVFLYDNAGTLTLELSAAWASDTARTDAISLQDGVWVKTGTPTRRLVGTLRMGSTTTTEDSLWKRYLWNVNAVPRILFKDMGSSSHAYNNSTVRQYNADTGAQVECVCGLLGQSAGTFGTSTSLVCAGTAALTRTGIGFNSTTAIEAGSPFSFSFLGSLQGGGGQCVLLRLGYNSITLLQASSATGTHTYDFGRIWGTVPL